MIIKKKLWIMSFKLNDIDQKMVNNLNSGGVKQYEGIFHAIYFLDNLTGSLLISKKYSRYLSPSSNEDLISGFLTALNLFIKEIKLGNKDDEIQEINFEETRILYERIGRLSVIAITNKSNLEFERYVLHQVVNDFYNRFARSIDHFNGSIEPSILDYKKKLEMLNLYYANFF